jgi:thermostable 8-oxoguanine DNA glycosylase
MTVTDYNGDLKQFLKKYKYQPDLTNKLDLLARTSLSQLLINEIVLWKVNRYVSVPNDILHALDQLLDLKKGEHRKGENILKELLHLRGADLPMASTLLRFRNPKTFQIIDRHAYRAIYGKKYPVHAATNKEKKIEIYFDYLDKLIELCSKKSLEFETIDRLLYIFDKEVNKSLKSLNLSKE